MGNLGTIFINYRKQDSEWKTETFYNELLNHFDKNSIFKDFTSIKPGEDFTVAIKNGLNKCNVFLVIIVNNKNEQIAKSVFFGSLVLPNCTMIDRIPVSNTNK